MSPIKPLSPGIQEHGPIPVQPPPPVAVYPNVQPSLAVQTVANPPPIVPVMPPPPVVSGHLGIYSQVRKKCEPGNIIPRFDRSATWEYFNIPRFRVFACANLGIFLI